MSLLKICSTTFAVIFWQLVNITTFGYGLAFLFWPEHSLMVFHADTQPALPLVRYMGVMYLLAAAGVNQVVATITPGGTKMSRTIFAFTLFEYLLAGVAGISVLALFEAPFTYEQRYAFFGLWIAFVSAITLGFLVNCSGYISCTVTTHDQPTAELTTTVVLPSRKTPVPSSRSAILAGRS